MSLSKARREKEVFRLTKSAYDDDHDYHDHHHDLHNCDDDAGGAEGEQEEVHRPGGEPQGRPHDGQDQVKIDDLNDDDDDEDDDCFMMIVMIIR